MRSPRLFGAATRRAFKKSLSLSLALGLLVILPAAVLAENDALLQQSIAAYNAKNFEKARTGLETYVKEGSQKPDGFYYLALTYHQLGQMRGAREIYAFIIKNFPGSGAAQMSKPAMDQLTRALTPGPATLPKETWIPFTRRGPAMIVEAKVNNKPMPMIFDTGAETCAFSFEHFRLLGLPRPSGPPNCVSLGVGKSEPVPEWQVKVDLTVGHIERKQFLVSVSENGLRSPLLGQDFCTGMEYSIDSTNNAISFKRRDAEVPAVAAGAARPGAKAGLTVDASGKYVYTVPFVDMGQCAQVKVLVNGKEIPMIFDTGAEISMFSPDQANQAGISLSGRKVEVGGIGGKTMATLATVDSIKLGPIEKTRMRVPVTDQTSIPIGLLGQDFLRGWHYTIDKQNRVIRFTRAEGANNY